MTEPSSIRGANIFVQDLRIQARVGVNPDEGAPQAILIDIWVGIEDMTLAARSEKLKDTMDYVGIARTARKVVEKRHYPLVESLAAAIAQALLAQANTTWARVRIRKLDCLRHASAAGVEVQLNQDEADITPSPMRIDQICDTEAVIIIGGGAAGLAAALWCWELGHPALLVDPGSDLGGQLHLVHGIMSNLPGMNPMPGAALNRRLLRQFVSYRGRWLKAVLTEITVEDAWCTLKLEDASGAHRTVRCKSAILTMGVRRRSLGVPGERELAGRGILSTAAKNIQHLAGRHVVVVGGGDAACENALMLEQAGARVTLLHRGPHLSAQQQFQRGVQTTPGVELRLNTRVTRFVGDAHLEEVVIEGAGATETLPAQGCLVRIGWRPNSEPLPEQWLNAEGFIQVDSAARVVGERRVMAAGDLLGRISPSVATAFGIGAIAARTAVMTIEQGDN